MKRFEISYNPYNNKIHFRVAIPIDEENVSDWNDLLPESSFIEFQNRDCVFEDCIEKIIRLINTYINTTEYLEIVFKGTSEDFEVLQNAVYASRDSRSKRITCTHSEIVLSSNTALERLKRSFSKVENEFDEYLESDEPDKKDVGDAVERYLETVMPEIPICVIGPTGSGKSALINALIGREVLPSQSNSSTAINVVVHNDKEFRIEFIYHGEPYKILLSGNGYSLNEPASPDEKLISLLFSNSECANEQEIIYHVLDVINNADDHSLIEELKNVVSVYLPFNPSRFISNDYSFSFIDSPVRISGYEDDPQIIIDDLVVNQTNSLAIVVSTRDAFTIDGCFDLKKLIDKLGSGFPKPNSIIAISKSDTLSVSYMKDEIPDCVREGIANPTIIYISPVVALGVKMDGTNEWIDKGQRALFEEGASILLKSNPPVFNISPAGRKSLPSGKEKRDKLLYASGITSLEQELNYFAKRYADYKKCTSGRRLLIEALDKLIVELKVSKKQAEHEFKNDIAKRREEQLATRAEMISALNHVEGPEVNKAITSVKNQFDPILDEYCKSVPETVRYYWGNVHARPYTVENLVKDMQQHCQENLYDKNDMNLRKALQQDLLALASDYKTRVRAYITEKEETLSPTALNELNFLFDTEASYLKFKDVDIKPFNAIGFSVFKTLGSDEKTINTYSKGFVEQLRTNGSRWGHFDRQCIVEPTADYSNQINQWASKLLADIQIILNSDSAIINKLDTRISDLESIIDDLDMRLEKLSNERAYLWDLIPLDERS